MDNKRMATNKHNSKDNSINLSDIINILIKNWKVFLVSTFLFLGIGVLYLLVKNPIYTVDALILLREDDKKSTMGMSPISMLSSAGDLSSIMGSKNVDNEVTVLNTRKIMKQSILDLNLYVICKSREGLKEVNLYPNCPFNVTVNPLEIDTVKRGFEFSIKPLTGNQYKVSGKYGDTKFEQIVSLFPVSVKTPSIDINIDKNSQYSPIEKERKIDVTIINPNVLAVLLNKGMTVGATSKKTSVIRFTTQTENVRLSQDLINRMIELFNQYAIDDKNLIAEKTHEFVTERLSKITEELSIVERQAENYKQENRLTDISSEAKLFLEQMGGYEKLRIETQIQLNMIQYIGEYVKNGENKEKLIPSIGIEDKGLLTTIDRYNQALIERDNLERSSSKANPAVALMNTQLTSMRDNIVDNIANITRSLEIRIRDIKNQDITTNNRIKAVPRQEREFLEIKRQQEVKQMIYSFLLQKREETELNLAATAPKAKIIDEPMPGIKTVAPKKMTTLAFMLFLGICIPFLWFYFKKFLNTKVESRE